MAGPDSGSDRGQAFTLEGIVSAAIVLTAVLFAIQSTVITPTTGGSVDPQVRSQLQREASDVLVTTAQNESYDLSALVRYYSPLDQTFEGAVNPDVGYGTHQPPGNLGTLLARTFTEHGRRYNVYVYYRGQNLSSDPKRETMVYQGQPGDDAVVASRTVTLYDNQTLTSSYSNRVELWQYDQNATDDDDGYYPIPNAVDGPVYNVVEVRLIVW
ncbi:MAG: hypothetical protein ABEJ31_00545 [Haloarculaceae archaeon]